MTYTPVITRARNAVRVGSEWLSNERLEKCRTLRLLSRATRRTPQSITFAMLGFLVLVLLLNPDGSAQHLTNILGMIPAYRTMAYLGSSTLDKAKSQMLMDYWLLYGTALFFEQLLGSAQLDKLVPLWWLFKGLAIMAYLLAPATDHPRCAVSFATSTATEAPTSARLRRPRGLMLQSSRVPVHTPYPEPSPSPAPDSDSTKVNSPISCDIGALAYSRGVTPSSAIFASSRAESPVSAVFSPYAPPSPPDSPPRVLAPTPLRRSHYADAESSDDEDPFAEDDLQDAEVVPATREKLSPTKAKLIRDALSADPKQVDLEVSSPEVSPQMILHPSVTAQPWSPIQADATTPDVSTEIEKQDNKVHRMSLDELVAMADTGDSIVL